MKRRGGFLLAIILGLDTALVWTRALGRLLRGQRYAMAAGFRGE